MVLTYYAYNETLDKQRQKEDDIAELKERVNKLMTMFLLAANEGKITAKKNRNNIINYECDASGITEEDIDKALEQDEELRKMVEGN